MLARRMSTADKNPTDLLRMKFLSSQRYGHHKAKNILFIKKRFYLSSFVMIPRRALLIRAINALLYILN